MKLAIAIAGTTTQFRPTHVGTVQYKYAFPSLLVASVDLPIVWLSKADIPKDSPYRPRQALLLIRRERDGEVWLSWPPLAEHGVGKSDAEAKAALWSSLCNYLIALETNTDQLGPPLQRELARLRRFIERR